jgi:hypothetical protein
MPWLYNAPHSRIGFIGEEIQIVIDVELHDR